MRKAVTRRSDAWASGIIMAASLTQLAESADGALAFSPSSQKHYNKIRRINVQIVAGKEVLHYNSKQTSSGCKWIRTSAQTPIMNKQEMLISKNHATILVLTNYDGEIWHRRGQESWRGQHQKSGTTRERQEVEELIRKATFGSASACVGVWAKIF
ncbi:hypothetical protein J6590_046642 [Homalodisca vitripennis]|nr:hypothetical protein J6590_046642 [Homalodisca vitripennis]